MSTECVIVAVDESGPGGDKSVEVTARHRVDGGIDILSVRELPQDVENVACRACGQSNNQFDTNCRRCSSPMGTAAGAAENVEWIEVATGQTDHSRIKFRLLVSEPVDPADLHSIATLLHRVTIKAEAQKSTGQQPAAEGEGK